VHPVLHEFDLFGLLREPWALHTYGVLIAAGFMIAMNLAKIQAAKEGEDPDRVVDLCFYALLWGLVGSRIVFILTKYREYIEKPAEIVMFWKGGLVFYGGFILATFYIVWYTRKNRLDFFKYADMLVPSLIFAHAFGRLGCLTAGCCFGKPTDSGLGIQFPTNSMAHAAHYNDGLVAFDAPSLAVHATQLYEAGFELGMFFLLTAIRARKRFHGQLFLIWLTVYPVVRSMIELFRGDKERGVWILGLSTSQIISMGVASAALGLIFHFRSTARPAAGATP
jgi:phosphatidylglycerol:prolipoprotein diacylglycerol transferase